MASAPRVPTSVSNTLDFAKFRDESSAIAQHVYDSIQEGKDQILPDSYISKWEPIAKKRVAVAAARLTYMIGELFGSKEEEQTFFLN